MGCEPSKPFCIRTATLISTLTRLCFSPTIQFPKASFAHNKTEGRTPLAYAVTKNLDRMTRDLIDIGADVNLLMGGTTTPLTIAALNKHRYVRHNIIIYIHTPEYTHTLCVCVCVCVEVLLVLATLLIKRPFFFFSVKIASCYLRRYKVNMRNCFFSYLPNQRTNVLRNDVNVLVMERKWSDCFSAKVQTLPSSMLPKSMLPS